MKTSHTNDHEKKRVKKHLWLIEAVLFVIAMLIAGASSAQDVQPPSLVSLSPTDNATEVAVDQWTYLLTFDEDVQINPLSTRSIAMLDDGGFTVAEALVGTAALSASTNTITVDFNYDGALDGTPLSENAEYHIIVIGDVIQDLAGNNYPGFTDNSSWNFFTIDTIIPTIAALNPGDDETGVLVNDFIRLSFAEAIVKGSGTLDLYDDSGLVESVDITSSDVFLDSTPNWGFIQWSPSSFLDPETNYYLLASPGLIEDLAGNDFPGISDPAVWNFTSMNNETDPPMVTDLGPPDDLTGILISDFEEEGMYMQFDEIIVPGTGNIEVRRMSDDFVIKSFDVNGPELSFDGEEGDGGEIYFDWTTGIPYNTEMYVSICGTCITDLLGNPFPANDPGDWNFTTELGPFQLVSLSPPNGSIDASKDSEVTLTFSHDADIGAGNIQVYKASDDSFVAQLSNFNGTFMTIDGRDITFDFPTDFPQGEELYINVSNAYLRSDENSDDWAGIQDNTSWRFTVEDLRPQILSFTPTTSDIIPGDLTLSITFDRDIALTTSSIPALRVYNSSDQQVAFFNKNGNINISGPTAEFPMSILLDSDESFYVTLGEGLFVDLNDATNPSQDIDDNSTWTFSTRVNDGNGPDLVTLSPANGETQVPRDGPSVEFSMTFDEPVYLGNTNGEVRIFRENPAGDVLYYNVGALTTISADNLTVTFDIPNNFTMFADTEYYITLDEVDGSGNPIIFDADGNGIAGITDENTWRFRTIAPLAVTSFNPENEAIDVPVDQVFTFTTNNELLAPTGGTIRIRNYETSQISRTIILPSPDVTVSGNTGSISFDGVGGDLNEGFHYYIDIASNVFRDAQNTTFTTSHKDTWNFTTADDNPPSVALLSPTDDKVNVNVTSNFQIYFDENIELGTGNITLYDENDQVVETYSATENFGQLTINTSSILINPTNDLQTGTGYYILIDNDAVKDDDGFDNFFAGISDNTFWNFSTPDVTGPLIVSFSPVDDASDVELDAQISIVYNEPIQEGSGLSNMSLRRLDNGAVVQNILNRDPSISISGNTLTLNLTNDLEYNTGYFLTMPSGYVEDLSGNNSTEVWSDNSTWNFTSRLPDDLDPPVLVSLDPVDGGTGVALDAILSITFDEPIQGSLNGGYVRVRRLSTGQQILGGRPAFETEIFDITGNTLSIDLAEYTNAAPINETDYYVTIQNNAIEDLIGNKYPGFDDNTTWNFRTADVTAPTVSSFSPTDDATNVGIGDNLILTFNEPVQGTGTGLIRIKNGNGTTRENFNLPDPNVTFSGNTVTINPTSDLSYGSDYYMEIPSDGIEDLEGNDFAGISDNTTWNFTTEKQAQTITFGSQDPVTYGGSQFNLTGSSTSGLVVTYVSSDLNVATVAGSLVTIVGAGTTTITASQSGNGQYAPAPQVMQDLVVNKAMLTATADDKTKTYGESNPGFSLSFTGFVNGDNSSVLDVLPPRSTSADETSDVGDYDIVVSGGSDDDYEYVHVNGTLTIEKATLTATAEDQSKTYGDPNPGFPLAFTGFVNGDVSSALDFLPNVSTSATTTSDVGDYTLEVTGGSDNNYQYNYVNGTLTINKANLTITADDKSKVFGDPIPALTMSYSGFANSDNEGDLDVLPGLSTSATASSNVGDYTISLTGGSDNNYSLTLNPGILSITKADQTITIDPITDKITTDAPFNVTASTTSGLTLDYSIASGPATILGTTITLTGSSGTVVVNVSQSGDGNYNSANETETFIVSDPAKSDQTITFDAIPDKTFGEDFTLNATASSGLEIDFTVVNGPISILGNSVTITGVGSATIAANQDGDGNYNPAMEVTRTFNITKADQVITIDPIADKVTTDGPFDVSATVTSGLSLDYSITGPASISGTTVTLDGNSGTVEITVSQAGNENYNSASQAVSFEVNEPSKLDQTITFADISDKTFGDASFELSGSASSGLNVIFSVVSGPITIAGTTVTINGAGTATVAANQSGDGDYNAAVEVTRTFSISKADQIITIDPIADKLTTDGPFDVSATVNTGLSLDYSVTGPASTSGNTVTLDGSSGTVEVTVSQAGNENYNAAAEAISFDVTDPAKMDQTISFAEITNKTFGDVPFELSGTSSSGLDVIFSVVSGPIAIDGTTVTISGAGSATIAANQSGDEDYNAAVEVTRTFTISKADQVITIEAIEDKLTSDDPFEVVATVDSDLELTYEVSGPASLAGTTLTLDGTVGTVTVTVSQAGNDNYNSASAQVSFEVTEENALSVDDEISSIRFYPNPVSDFLFVESDQSASLHLFDLNGKLLVQNLKDGKRLDVRNVTPGVYLLEIRTENNRIQKRIVKAN